MVIVLCKFKRLNLNNVDNWVVCGCVWCGIIKLSQTKVKSLKLWKIYS
jgi:hypothetical protein